MFLTLAYCFWNNPSVNRLLTLLTLVRRKYPKSSGPYPEFNFFVLIIRILIHNFLYPPLNFVAFE